MAGVHEVLEATDKLMKFHPFSWVTVMWGESNRTNQFESIFWRESNRIELKLFLANRNALGSKPVTGQVNQVPTVLAHYIFSYVVVLWGTVNRSYIHWC